MYFVAGAALSRGRALGTALSQGVLQISWQVQHFRKVRYRSRGRRSTFASLRADFVWQAQRLTENQKRETSLAEREIDRVE